MPQVIAERERDWRRGSQARVDHTGGELRKSVLAPDETLAVADALSFATKSHRRLSLARRHFRYMVGTTPREFQRSQR
jgi:hypothetical protein